ncbi:MAG: CocE/NonD family hydrolase, partial [Dehalococcoidia bacterium]
MIPPHTRLEGPQYAGWTPRVVPPATHLIALEAAVPVPMPDGVNLRGDVYRPRAPGRFPALLSWSAYPRYIQTCGLPLFNNEAGVTGVIVARGYAHVLVNARGIEGSGGAYDPWFSPQEQRDMAETIAWIAAQPWCDGNVGMSGISYFAISQLLAAAQRPPALKAIFAYDFSTDLYRHILYHGGLVNSDFDALYAGINGSTLLLDHALSPRARNALSYVTDREWISQGFARLTPRLMGRMLKSATPKPEFVRAYCHVIADEPYGGAWYDERSPAPVLDRIEVPAGLGVTQGAVSLHQFGPYDAWHRMTAPRKLFIAGPDAARPWKTFQGEMLAWYDHHLKGIDNGYEALPPVRYWLQGANTWRQAADWPLPNSERRQLFLRQRAGDPMATQGLAE